MAEPLSETQAPDSTPGRESILAELASLRDGEAKAAPVEAVDSADEDEDEDEPVEAAEVADDETEEPGEDAEDLEATDDPKAAKGLDVVRRAEKRHRETMDRDRAEFAREQEKHAAALAKVDTFEAAARRVKYDPAALLKTLGVSEDDYELIAHAIFAESKAGAADPKRKEAAAHRLREREKEDKLSATEKKIADMEAKLEARDKAAAQEIEASRYVAQLTAAAGARPLAAHMLKVDPEEANEGMVAAYNRIAAKGKDPSPIAVVAEYDRHLRIKLTKLGIDPDTIAKNKPGAVVNGKKTATPAAKVANVNAPKTRDEIIAELASLHD